MVTLSQVGANLMPTMQSRCNWGQHLYVLGGGISHRWRGGRKEKDDLGGYGDNVAHKLWLQGWGCPGSMQALGKLGVQDCLPDPETPPDLLAWTSRSHACSGGGFKGSLDE